MRTPYTYGMTNLYSALRRLRTEILTEEHGDRPTVQNIALIITDGRSNLNTRLTTGEARQLKAAGLAIAAIGVKMEDLRELVSVVSDPADRFMITVDDFEDLPKLGPRMAFGLCRGDNISTLKY